ncbi:YicC/YloC family endoribonuclease [Thalassovita sp.]|uniref:YicC/YloC family endoribonuclease n=1 Tax=Thalassovita sp. TaxID=1979401 RepID=UPI002882528A|nr:YicC/YloC family endoribonuclease [Thalassovita sp.]MDF1801309.1 YicC family protein [Thalassovita sp.]
MSLIKSMTGFASGTAEHSPFSWTWELRSVNAKGLDLRLRVPDWIEGLETALRGVLGKRLGRGSVSLSLKLTREEGAGALTLNAGVLSSVLEGMRQIEETAMQAGVSLTPASAADVLAIRGVMEMRTTPDDSAALRAVLLADFDAIVVQFLEMRAAEGRALDEILMRQIDQIDTLTSQATAVIETRKDDMERSLRAGLDKVLQNYADTDEQRIAQELALIAVKSDVTEELDRLTAHVAAARDLMAQDGPVGRKLDFLMQEFNREANTLCAKSQHTDLTRVGLELKTVIDQMREQVQNVE